MATEKIGIGHKRLIALIDVLEKKGINASLEGLAKIVVGELDEETLPLKDEPFFGLSPSLGKKKVKSRLNYLYRYQFISAKYCEEMDDYYYVVGPKGLPYVDFNLLAKKAPAPKKPTIIINK